MLSLREEFKVSFYDSHEKSCSERALKEEISKEREKRAGKRERKIKGRQGDTYKPIDVVVCPRVADYRRSERACWILETNINDKNMKEKRKEKRRE